MSGIYTAPKPRELYIDDITPNVKSLYSSLKTQELIDGKLNSVIGLENELLVIGNNGQIKTSNETLNGYSKILHTHQGANISIDTSSFGNNLSSYEDNLQSLADRIDNLGIVGKQGVQGIQGPKGDKGNTGIQGIQGIKGNKGDTGLQGPSGVSGPKGDIGNTGKQGIQGTQGIKGDKGNTPTFEEGTGYSNPTYLYVVFGVDGNWISNRYIKTNLTKTTSGIQNNTKPTTLTELQNLIYN